MNVKRVDKNEYSSNDAVVERIQIEINFSSMRLKEADAYLLCYEILNCLNNEN
jgi:hypothetical protein